MTRIWVTRSLPAAEATAERLRDLGHDPLVDPVLEVRRLPAEIDLDGIAALAFTSLNGVAAFAALSAERDLAVFAVGDATADAARAAGFARVESAAGDARTLAAMIGGRAAEIHGAVLVVSPREPAADLATLLNRRGIEARRVDVYETLDTDPKDALETLFDIDWVLVHSPKAARRLSVLLGPGTRRDLGFLCISQNAAAPLLDLGLEKVRIAPFPEEAALLKLVGEETARAK